MLGSHPNKPLFGRQRAACSLLLRTLLCNAEIPGERWNKSSSLCVYWGEALMAARAH